MRAFGIEFVRGRGTAALLAVVTLVFCAPVVMGGQPGGRAMPEVAGPDDDRLIVGVVHRVIDGDSVELFLDGQIVAYELAGADAPEVLEKGSVSLRGGAEARGYLLALLSGEQVAVLPDVFRPVDALGRRRGYLYRMPDKLFVNLEMVRLGFSKHARDARGFNEPAMVWAQGRARDARKGVWSPVPVPVEVAKAKPAAAEPAKEEPAADEPSRVDVEVSVLEPAAGYLMVYVTKSGTKYHTKDCQHARVSGVATPLEKVESTHEACKVCNPGDAGGD